MRLGDWIVACSAGLNFLALVAYAAQGHWPNAVYFAGACLINGSILWMR